MQSENLNVFRVITSQVLNDMTVSLADQCLTYINEGLESLWCMYTALCLVF